VVADKDIVMTVIGPFNYQAIYESDVWNVYHALGMGYSVFLIHPSNGPTLWLVPPSEKYGLFDTKPYIADVLIENGLVEKITRENLPYDAEAIYQLTDKGTELLASISEEVEELPEHQRFPAGGEILKRKIKLELP
jgi:hypothetical protein